MKIKIICDKCNQDFIGLVKARRGEKIDFGRFVDKITCPFCKEKIGENASFITE